MLSEEGKLLRYALVKHISRQSEAKLQALPGCLLMLNIAQMSPTPPSGIYKGKDYTYFGNT